MSVDTDTDDNQLRLLGTSDEVTVTVEIPLDENSYVPNQFFGGRTVVRELTLRREGIR